MLLLKNRSWSRDPLVPSGAVKLQFIFIVFLDSFLGVVGADCIYLYIHGTDYCKEQSDATVATGRNIVAELNFNLCSDHDEGGSLLPTDPLQ